MEHGRRPDGKRKIERVAESVGEEQFGHRVRAVGRREVQHVARVRLGTDEHVVLQMHRALGETGRPRAVQPEADVVRIGRGGCQFCGGGSLQIRESVHGDAVRHGRKVRVRRVRVRGHDEVTQIVELVDDRQQARQQRGADDHSASPRILQQVQVVAGLEKRCERHGHDACLDRTEEDRREIGRIEHHHREPLLEIEPEFEQRAPGAVHGLQHVRVAVHGVVGDVTNRDVVAAACVDVGVDERGGGVESARQVEPGVLLDDAHQSSLAPQYLQ